MSREPDNPFLAPAMMARPLAPAGAQPAWLMWMVGTFVAETALTLTTIFLDSRDVLNDSGQVTFAANGVLWFFLTVAVALRFPFAIACGLTVVLGVIGWITMIMVAFFAVPAMLNGSIGHPVYGYAAMSCLAGIVVVPFVVFPVSKLFPRSVATRETISSDVLPEHSASL